jgi:hypothetical protein
MRVKEASGRQNGSSTKWKQAKERATEMPAWKEKSTDMPTRKGT